MSTATSSVETQAPPVIDPEAGRASVEWITWARQRGLITPPKTTQGRTAARRHRLEQLDHQIERKQKAIAAADDRIWERRQETHLARLEAERDRLEADEQEYEELAEVWDARCFDCGEPIAHSDYGRARCGRCAGRGAGS